MTEIKTKEYITKSGTVYEHTKEFANGKPIKEYWTKNSKKIEAAGYVTPLDMEELANQYKKIIVLPNLKSDSTIGVGEIRSSDSLITLINDFKYSGDQELRGRIVFLENSGSKELKISSPIEKIVTNK